MQNCPVSKEFYSEHTKPTLIKMGDFFCRFCKSGKYKLILPRNFVYAGKNYCEQLIQEAHVAAAYGGVEKTIQTLTHRYQSQS